MSQEKLSDVFYVWINMSTAYSRAHLFDSVQRGSYGDDWHDNDGHSIVVVLIRTPQNHTEQLEDVKRVQDLKEETGEKCGGKQSGFQRRFINASYQLKARHTINQFWWLEMDIWINHIYSVRTTDSIITAWSTRCTLCSCSLNVIKLLSNRGDMGPHTPTVCLHHKILEKLKGVATLALIWIGYCSILSGCVTKYVNC